MNTQAIEALNIALCELDKEIKPLLDARQSIELVLKAAGYSPPQKIEVGRGAPIAVVAVTAADIETASPTSRNESIAKIRRFKEIVTGLLKSAPDNQLHFTEIIEKLNQAGLPCTKKYVQTNLSRAFDPVRPMSGLWKMKDKDVALPPVVTTPVAIAVAAERPPAPANPLEDEFEDDLVARGSDDDEFDDDSQFADA